METDEPALVARWRRAIIYDDALASSTKLVALVLHDFWGADGSCAPWGRRPESGAGPSAATLSKLCGVNRRTIYRALAELEKRGWVSVTFRSRGRDTNRYIATLPAEKKTKRRRARKAVTAEDFPEFANER